MTSVTSLLVPNAATPSDGGLPTPLGVDPASDAAFRAALAALKTGRVPDNATESEISGAETADDGDTGLADQARDDTKLMTASSETPVATEVEVVAPETLPSMSDSEEEPSPQASMLETALKIANEDEADLSLPQVTAITGVSASQQDSAETVAKPPVAELRVANPQGQLQPTPQISPDASAPSQPAATLGIVPSKTDPAITPLRLDITSASDRVTVAPTQQGNTASPPPVVPLSSITALPRSASHSPNSQTDAQIVGLAKMPRTETAAIPLMPKSPAPVPAPTAQLISPQSELPFPMAVAPSAVDMPLFADDAPDGLGTTASTLATGASRAAIAMPHHVPPAIVMQQIAEAARTLPNAPVEITLSPEELGRVRMTLTMSETGMSVNVTVERDETLALLRRHSEMLSGALGDLDLGALDIGFHQEGDSTPGNQTGGGQGATLLEPLTPTTLEPHGPTLLPQDRLDIRL